MKSDGFITHATWTDAEDDMSDSMLIIEDCGSKGFALVKGDADIITIAVQGGSLSFDPNQAAQLIEALQTIVDRYSG
jgi:hypothetical protein